MTVGEFIEKAKGHEDCELVVRKHDKWQLTCHTTVPVERVYMGFDWTMGQFILEPKIQLVTSADEVSKAMSEKLKDYSSRLTRALSIGSRIAMMLKDIPDENLRNRIHNELKELGK